MAAARIRSAVAKQAVEKALQYRLPRPQAQEAHVPRALDPAHQRRRPRARPDLRPIYRRPRPRPASRSTARCWPISPSRTRPRFKALVDQAAGCGQEGGVSAGVDPRSDTSMAAARVPTSACRPQARDSVRTRCHVAQASKMGQLIMDRHECGLRRDRSQQSRIRTAEGHLTPPPISPRSSSARRGTRQEGPRLRTDEQARRAAARGAQGLRRRRSTASRRGSPTRSMRARLRSKPQPCPRGSPPSAPTSRCPCAPVPKRRAASIPSARCSTSASRSSPTWASRSPKVPTSRPTR